MEKNFLNLIQKHFIYLEELPVAASIISTETKEVIHSNQLFQEMVDAKSMVQLDELPVDKPTKTIIKIETDREDIHLLTSTKIINFENQNLLLCTHEDLSYIEDSMFTASFIKLDTDSKTLDSNEKNEAIDTSLSIIKACIRQTDNLIKLNQNEYIIVFPRCSFEIVENIMSGMTNKFDVFNEISDTKHGLLLDYNIIEYSDKKLRDFIDEYGNSTEESPQA